MVADMSSDIFSRPVDIEKYACIYAGAQKNMGPAGTVLYIYDKEAAGKHGRDLPSYLDLAVHAEQRQHVQHPAGLRGLHQHAHPSLAPIRRRCG